MKKIYRILLLALMIGVASGCARQNNDINNQKVQEQQEKTDDKSTDKSDSKKLYVSFYPIEYMAKEIAKDKIDVVNVMPKGASVHEWEPTAQDIKNLSDSKMLIVNGLGLEGWLEDVKSSLKNTEIVDSSANIEKIKAEEEHDHDHDHEAEENHNHNHNHEAEENHNHNHEATENNHDHEDHDHEGHHHGPMDPHVWISPKNAKIEMENIKNGLVELDKDNADYYESNYQKYAKMLDELDAKYKESLENLPKKEIVVSHEAYGYLCKDYGLTQIGVKGVNAETEPDAKKMA
ncbi:MAG: metal ABC transporter substrate-binding protein, partial [Finegoldia magna]|uniref:metal ABC transporter substrate-binding protein n=1 Tax=Finegoldia magna TaxID=1260 RepID=UPI0029104E19